MTRKERSINIDQMPAGKQLDEKVAVEVVGLVRGKDWHSPCFDDLFCDNPCPPYSTDDATAISLLDRIPFSVTLSREDKREGVTGKYAGRWTAILDYVGGALAMDASGDTLPLAICRLLLLATERFGDFKESCKTRKEPLC